MNNGTRNSGVKGLPMEKNSSNPSQKSLYEEMAEETFKKETAEEKKKQEEMDRVKFEKKKHDDDVKRDLIDEMKEHKKQNPPESRVKRYYRKTLLIKK